MDLLRCARFFVTMAEERQFGFAARRIGISRPLLSHGLQRLEAERACTCSTAGRTESTSPTGRRAPAARPSTAAGRARPARGRGERKAAVDAVIAGTAHVAVGTLRA